MIALQIFVLTVVLTVVIVRFCLGMETGIDKIVSAIQELRDAVKERK